MDKFYKFFALKALICFTAFVISVLALGDESLTFFWVALLSSASSLGFYLVGE